MPFNSSGVQNADSGQLPSSLLDYCISIHIKKGDSLTRAGNLAYT